MSHKLPCLPKSAGALMQHHAAPGSRRLCRPGYRLLHPAQNVDPFACLRAGHQSSLQCTECLLHCTPNSTEISSANRLSRPTETSAHQRLQRCCPCAALLCGPRKTQLFCLHPAEGAKPLPVSAVANRSRRHICSSLTAVVACRLVSAVPDC